MLTQCHYEDLKCIIIYRLNSDAVCSSANDGHDDAIDYATAFRMDTTQRRIGINSFICSAVIVCNILKLIFFQLIFDLVLAIWIFAYPLCCDLLSFSGCGVFLQFDYQRKHVDDASVLNTNTWYICHHTNEDECQNCWHRRHGSPQSSHMQGKYTVCNVHRMQTYDWRLIQSFQFNQVKIIVSQFHE